MGSELPHTNHPVLPIQQASPSLPSPCPPTEAAVQCYRWTKIYDLSIVVGAAPFQMWSAFPIFTDFPTDEILNHFSLLALDSLQNAPRHKCQLIILTIAGLTIRIILNNAKNLTQLRNINVNIFSTNSFAHESFSKTSKSCTWCQTVYPFVQLVSIRLYIYSRRPRGDPVLHLNDPGQGTMPAAV